MNIERTICGVTGLALILAAAPALNAQRGFGGPMGRGFGGGFGEFRMGSPVAGAPYSATRTITRVEKLENGATITHTTVIHEARDENGRLYRQAVSGDPSHPVTEYSVFDPVNRVSMHWSSLGKQAEVMHLPDPDQAAAHWAHGAETGVGRGSAHAKGLARQGQVESLGSKTISGLVADGTRTTRVIPAGAQGNDQPLTITHESWVSSDMKIELERVDSDPRVGTTTVQVTNVSRNEPPATLFAAPAGYTVVDRYPGQHGPLFNAAR
jgi:hypothetical protein